MIDFEFGEDGGARTCEGWVKHDLESGSLGTYWLGNAVSDALMDHPEDPAAYVTALLDEVNVSDKDKIAALIWQLVTTFRENSRG